MDYDVFDPYYAVNHLNQTTSLAHKKVAVESKYVSRFGEDLEKRGVDLEKLKF